MSEEVQLSVMGAQFGQLLRDVDGNETVAMEDMVVLVPFVNGVQQVPYNMTPEQAITIAQALAAKAGELINAEVDDRGKPTGLIHRLRRLGAQA